MLQNAEDGEELGTNNLLSINCYQYIQLLLSITFTYLDIYQVTSFLKYYHPKHKSDRGRYAFYCFKCIICALIQTLGMVAFLNYVIKTNWDEHKIECTMKAEWDLRSVAVLFSAYISVSLWNIIRELTQQGLYENRAYLPPFLANEWVYLGLYCNSFTLMAATAGSFLLIYTADSTVDIVLNSVALYFIIELDNNLVDHFDCLRIANWMKNDCDRDEWFSEERLKEVKYKRICGMNLQTAGRMGGCNRLKLCWVFLGGIFVLSFFLFLL